MVKCQFFHLPIFKNKKGEGDGGDVRLDVLKQGNRGVIIMVIKLNDSPLWIPVGQHSATRNQDQLSSVCSTIIIVCRQSNVAKATCPINVY